MALNCAISGEVPQEPVVSPVSGAVFEKRLIEKHLLNSQTDPINGEPLTVDQLVKLNVPKVVRPRPPNATSVPSLLKLFQDEWDAVMLETFKMKQHVETVRQELSHALYQHDAACRVIARLTKERDQARQALAVLQPVVSSGPAAEGNAMEVDGSTEDAIAKIQAKSDELSKGRKKRPKAAELATPEDIAAFSEKSSNSSLHSASAPGITALDLHPVNNHIVATGGVDKQAIVYNHSEDKIVSVFKGHTKKISSVILHPSSDVVLSSSLDSTVSIWNSQNGESLSTISTHTKAVTSISLHPIGDYVLSGSLDKSWAFSDIQTGKTISSSVGAAGVSSIQWHPDGIIFGAGTSDNVVRIWDIKQPSNIHNFEGHTGSVSAVAFSENGYYLASASEDHTVKLWDLRKLVNFKTIDLQGDAPLSLHFDYSGLYLAIGASKISVYQTKTWDLLTTLGNHSGPVTGVRFGQHARLLASASMDRAVKIFA